MAAPSNAPATCYRRLRLVRELAQTRTAEAWDRLYQHLDDCPLCREWLREEYQEDEDELQAIS